MIHIHFYYSGKKETVLACTETTSQMKSLTSNPCFRCDKISFFDFELKLAVKLIFKKSRLFFISNDSENWPFVKLCLLCLSYEWVKFQRIVKYQGKTNVIIRLEFHTISLNSQHKALYFWTWG